MTAPETHPNATPAASSGGGALPGLQLATRRAFSLDLPSGWGLLLVEGLRTVTCLRPARKLRDVSMRETAALRASIARALTYRAARAAGVLALR
jgi:hypothetical protein